MGVGTIRVGKITATGGDGTYTFTEQLRKADNSGWENASAGAGVVGGTVRDVNDSTAGAVDDLILFWLESGLGSSTHYICDLTATGGAVPTGVVQMYTGDMDLDPPRGYLWANGQAVSRTTYAALFAIIGTTYGVGDGSTTFNVPDTCAKFWKGSNVDSDRGTTGGESVHGDGNNDHDDHPATQGYYPGNNPATLYAFIDDPDPLGHSETDNEPPWWNGPGIIKT